MNGCFNYTGPSPNFTPSTMNLPGARRSEPTCHPSLRKCRMTFPLWSYRTSSLKIRWQPPSFFIPPMSEPHIPHSLLETDDKDYRPFRALDELSLFECLTFDITETHFELLSYTILVRLIMVMKVMRPIARAAHTIVKPGPSSFFFHFSGSSG